MQDNINEEREPSGSLNCNPFKADILIQLLFAVIIVLWSLSVGLPTLLSICFHVMCLLVMIIALC